MLQRSFFATLALAAVCIVNPVWGQQAPGNKVENPPPVIIGNPPKETPKPVVVSFKVDSILSAAVDVDCDCVFVAKTVFLEDLVNGKEVIAQKGDRLEETITVKNLKTTLPVNMKVLTGSSLTLPPGKALPKPPEPPAEPKYYKIGKKSVTIDKVRDAKNREMIDTYVLEKLEEHEARLKKVEAAITEIQKRLGPDEKAALLGAIPTGEMYETDTRELICGAGEPSRPLIYRRSYYNCRGRTIHVYEFVRYQK